MSAALKTSLRPFPLLLDVCLTEHRVAVEVANAAFNWSRGKKKMEAECRE